MCRLTAREKWLVGVGHKLHVNSCPLVMADLLGWRAAADTEGRWYCGSVFLLVTDCGSC